jgi:hypothetical protein
MHLAFSPANSSGLISAVKDEERSKSPKMSARDIKPFDFFTGPPPKKIWTAASAASKYLDGYFTSFFRKKI